MMTPDLADSTSFLKKPKRIPAKASYVSGHPRNEARREPAILESVDVQKLAVKNYHLWRENPSHPSLRFRRRRGAEDRFTIRVGDHYRALGRFNLRDDHVGLDRQPFGVRPTYAFGVRLIVRRLPSDRV